MAGLQTGELDVAFGMEPPLIVGVAGAVVTDPAAREALEQWRDRRAHATAAALDELDEADRTRLAEALPLIARVAAALPSEDVVPEALPSQALPSGKPADRVPAKAHATRPALSEAGP